MGYQYTTINGQRVEVTVAAAFQKLRAAFKAKFGLDLLVSSGTRTRAEQQRLYDGWVKRLPGYNLAAPPGYSNHEESGPRGPRALDVRDSGSDWGVTRAGTPRAKWLKSNAPKYGFDPAGYRFSQVEPWHIEYTGALGQPAGATTPKVKYSKAHMVKVQRALITLGYDLSPYGADGVQGPITTAAVTAFQKKTAGLVVDGLPGPRTLEELEKAVAALTPPVPSPVEPEPVVPVEPEPVDPPVSPPSPVEPEPVEPEPIEPIEPPTLPPHKFTWAHAGVLAAVTTLIAALTQCGGPA